MKCFCKKNLGYGLFSNPRVVQVRCHLVNCELAAREHKKVPGLSETGIYVSRIIPRVYKVLSLTGKLTAMTCVPQVIISTWFN